MRFRTTCVICVICGLISSPCASQNSATLSLWLEHLAQEYPRLQASALEELLQELRKELSEKLQGLSDPATKIETTCRYLFRERRFSFLKEEDPADATLLHLEKIVRARKGSRLGVQLLFLTLAEEQQLPVALALVPGSQILVLQTPQGWHELDTETGLAGVSLSEFAGRRKIDPERAQAAGYFRPLSPPELSGMLHLQRARRWLARGRPERALHDLEEAKQGMPGGSETAEAWGEALWQAGRTEEAREVLEALLEKHPQPARPLWLLARMAWARGAAAEALERLDEALDLDPHYRPAQLDQARIYALREDWTKALLILKRLIEQHPDDAEAWLLRDRVQMDREKAELRNLPPARPARAETDPAPIPSPQADRAEPNVRDLVETMNGADRDRARLAYQALLALGATARDPLREMLLDKNTAPGLRAMALRMLREHHADDPELPSQVAGLLDAPDRLLKIEAIKTLGSLDEPTFNRRLSPLLTDADPEIRLWSACTLAQRGDDDATEPLIQFLDADQTEFRWLAARGLSYLKDEKSLPALARHLADPAWIVRVHAVRALRAFPLRAGFFPSLLERLEDPQPEVRREAVRTLESWTGQSLGADRKRWENWWERNRHAYQ
jgi:HEAT repeat protein/regulator of sirC expression with transglutaminase-like and TPR domain